ncbi:MAG: hypothetical protein H0X73_10515, partial [Chthoniobacterales bacterium]|nr:hypothetical protein [Chthoniobacterales bacterium]
MKLKTLMISALAATAFVGARADEVTIAGSTNGQFSGSGTSVYKSLSFNSGAFDQTTFLNEGAVGGMA